MARIEVASSEYFTISVSLPPMILCGVVRNAGAELRRSLAAMDAIASRAEKSHMIVVTNDNSDCTELVLRQWSASNGAELIVLNGLAGAIVDRVERIATARNFYLQRIRDRRFDDFDVVCVMDLDGANSAVHTDDIRRAMRADVEWDALFANQRQAYYDIFALRHKTWCPVDCWQEVAAASASPLFRRNRSVAIRKYVHDRQFRIAPATPLITVDSAFGGLALYRKNVVGHCWYGSRSQSGEATCEHVVLHQQLRARGAKLHIAPALLNDAPPEHLGPTSGRPFPVQRMGLSR